MKKGLGALVAVAVLLTGAYAYLYQVAPLPEPWNEALLGLILTLAAALGAGAMSLVARQFDPDEPAGHVWRAFAWGLWAWALAELIWTAYPVWLEEFPVLSLADVFWMAGYVGLATALIRQHRLVYGPQSNWGWRSAALVVVGVLGVSSLLTALALALGLGSDEGVLAVFLNVFYPLGDLALAVAAWHTARLFRGGRWARPWLALLGFVVADALYTWLILTGIYSFEGNLLSLVADLVYLNAYMLLALVVYSHLMLIHQGIRADNLTGQGWRAEEV